MKNIRLHADRFGASPTTIPELTMLTASDKNTEVEIVIGTMRVPIACALMLVSAQKGVSAMNPVELPIERDLQLEEYQSYTPEAIGLELIGNMLRVRLDCGDIFFKLSDAAKNELGRVSDNL